MWLLAAVAASTGYRSHVWLTYKQAVALGGVVRKGEKGTPVVFWKQLQVEDRDEAGQKKTIPFLRYFTVFNTEQTEGCTFDAATIKRLAPPDVPTGFDPVVEAETVFEGMPSRPSVTFDGGNRAFYRPDSDTVHLPPRETFHDAAGFYETLFHELGHATGHASRVGRKVEGNPFGSHDYGREELVAEMTSAFVLATVGLEQETLVNAAAYIASWKRAIAADESMVVWAASQAQKAADFILGVALDTRETLVADQKETR